MVEEHSPKRRGFLGRMAALSTMFGTVVAMRASAGAERPASANDAVAAHGCADMAEQDMKHLRRAIELSDLAASPEYGHNAPFGAVLMLGDGTVVEGWNHALSNNNSTHHAELWLISHTLESMKLDWRGKDRALLARSTLYASTEPCAMCAGAVYWAGIGRVVFGCSLACMDEVLKKFFPESWTGLPMPSRQVLDSSARRTIIVGPCLEDEARRVHESYWPRFTGRT